MSTWAIYHSESERHATQAEIALRGGDPDGAIRLYGLAAEDEVRALNSLDPTKTRTLGITAVSAAVLWFKAGELSEAQRIAHECLSRAGLPAFAVDQLRNLLQVIWNEEARREAGIDFAKGEVLVAVSGGEVVRGGAPLDLVVRKVNEVSSLFYRTVEMMLQLPVRRRSAPSEEIQSHFRPWLFQAVPSSYQFAVRVQAPAQLSLFPEWRLETDEIVGTFLQVVGASTQGDPDLLNQTIPDQGYQEVFLKLTRNLAPTDKTKEFNRVQLQPSGGSGLSPVVLLPASRDTINKSLRERKTRQAEGAGAVHEPTLQLAGTLRALHLERDWIEVKLPDGRDIKVYQTGEVIDDVVGPMVNRRVIVEVAQRPNGTYRFVDIQAEE